MEDFVRATNRRPRRAAAERSEAGSAMIVTLMVMAVVTALATTVATVTINNVQSSWRAQQAGAAVNAADAGIAQAMSYLRNSGVRDLKCSPTCGGNPWGNESSPATVSVPGDGEQVYRTWIEPVAPFPENEPGVYRIHSTGTATGQASRAVVADVLVNTSEVPMGIFARTISGGGDASVARESIFSTGCVYNRSKIQMTGMDLAYGIPVAVHSSQTITDSNGTGQYCPSTNKPIHREAPQYRTAQACDPRYPYDQDRLGGSLIDTSCYDSRMATDWARYYQADDLDGDGANDVDGSYIEDDATLFSLFGIRSPALSQAQIDQLRTTAHSQGNYWTAATGWTSPDETQAVMYFDLSSTDAGGVVDLNDIVGFGRDPDMSATDVACGTRSLVIVIDGGNVRLNSNQKLAASVFLTSNAPYGQVFKSNGTSQFIGTLYADTVNLAGTTDLSMDECFLDNPSPALLDFKVRSYRELDR
jgi:type II secretory pathway pseudopilin PulG